METVEAVSGGVALPADDLGVMAVLERGVNSVRREPAGDLSGRVQLELTGVLPDRRCLL